MKASVRAYSTGPLPAISPPGRPASSAASVPVAITTAATQIPAHMRGVITPTAGSRGARRISAGSGGSMPTASAGNESVTRLTQRICTASSGRTRPAAPPAVRPSHPASTTPKNIDQHLAQVGRQEIAQELLDVGVDRAPLLDRRDDRGEVVVGEHDVGGLLRDVGPGDAHRDADVGGLERRRVVHAVAGHGDDLAARVQRAHDGELVLRADARVDRRPAAAAASSASDIAARSAPISTRSPRGAMPELGRRSPRRSPDGRR